ncbi:S8 family peptidase [Amphiplicatus metriothermophilus]|uniref:Serine protease, subtilisin family n=1 Tax=Amphiplicatus metriothermophilus TaxID=1519374 RepID=A0A239PY39_9PROT|nr:S8 family peptidase [Amphiplicatus metriothermophilus]MBB5519973.1 hypothetical protein [Amphiplicatus metriothermophilus]SNT74872.1 Serine protease, subtilisin family [Amphiplicatus metriothermophilus]
MKARRGLWRAAVAALTLAGLAGCSSNGGSAPTAMSPPPTSNFRTAEFERNQGLEQINVVPAYEAGALGAGVIVSVIDTGIDVNHPEFAGRIDPRSADLVVAGVVPPEEQRSPSLQDVDGHGTSVAGIIGAAKNDLGTHGVAPEATLLVFRGDKTDDSDVILGEAIAEGAQRSADFGAVAINLSLGSNEPGARDGFRSIFNFTSLNDMAVAIAAGNEGLSNPEESALAATDPEARGTVIVVGAVDFNGVIASFSNRAGAAADVYLVAPGVNIPTPVIGGSASDLRSFSGTSAATPFVTAAAALLRELWPQLSAREVVSILLDSATDLGAPGTDPIYGRGLLNVGAAVQPSGATATASASGAAMPVDLGSAGLSFGPAFGSALDVSGDFVFLDGYGRDFRAPLRALVGAPRSLAFDPADRIQPFVHYKVQAMVLGRGTVQFRLLREDRAGLDASAGLRARAFSPADEEIEHRLHAAFAMPLAQDLSVVASHGFSPREADRFLVARALAPTASRDGFADAYLPAEEGGVTAALRWSPGRNWKLDILAANADGRDAVSNHVVFAPVVGLDGIARSTLRIAATRRLPFGEARIEAGLLREAGGILGARIGGPFGEGVEAVTWHRAFAFDLALADGWRAQGRYAAGVTEAITDGAGFLADADDLTSTQFAFGLYRSGLLRKGDLFSVSALQPLRVESGALLLLAPERYDYRADAFSFAERRIALGEGPRPFDLEARYAVGGLFGGYMEANVLRQFNVDAAGGDAWAGLLRAAWSF